MSRTIIIYYSLEGNIDFLARAAAKGGIVTGSLAFVNPLKKPQESLEKLKEIL